jgi:hypothetical protein
MESTWLEFDWLLEDRRHLRGNLRAIEAAIRRGRFAGAHMAGRRRRLVEVVSELIETTDLSPRALIRLARLVEAMARDDLGDLDYVDDDDD